MERVVVAPLEAWIPHAVAVAFMVVFAILWWRALRREATKRERQLDDRHSQTQAILGELRDAIHGLSVTMASLVTHEQLEQRLVTVDRRRAPR
jgi:membrane protein implicated in regulation of membrane protease activity